MGQPNQTHEQQRRYNRQSHHAKPEIQPQQYADDANQQHEIADGEHGRLEEFLQCIDVTLQARHQSTHLGFVHEGKGDTLQMQVHGATQIE
jgi:hypothetical protein